GLLLEDRGSRNGTLVDGVAVLKAHVRGGTVLRLGRSALRVDVGEEPIRVAISAKKQVGLMVGVSAEMRRCSRPVERAARSDAAVLLRGETGTGKEVAAESIHRESERREGPFVVVDCASIPANLLESELFGHERGAFTGALAQRQGAFEAASGGTLFLDEIGELPLELQPKLLRVLEAHQVKRVGGRGWFEVDVRVIAATHRDLEAEVNTQRFRSDLYYRLAVLEVRLPPLRGRHEDLPLLVERLLADRPEAELCRGPDFLAHLQRHAWPGNVRELRNYLERCVAFNERVPLAATPATPAIDTSQPYKRAKETWLQLFESQYVARALADHDG